MFLGHRGLGFLIVMGLFPNPFFCTDFLRSKFGFLVFSKHGCCMESIVKHNVSQKSFSIEPGFFRFFRSPWGSFLIFTSLQPCLKIDTFSGCLQIQNSPVPKRNHRQLWACKHFYSSWPTAESRTDDCWKADGIKNPSLGVPDKQGPADLFVKLLRNIYWGSTSAA